MGRRVLLALVSAAVLIGLPARPGAAVNTPQAVVVSSNPADWTPHVLDGKVAAIVQVGNKMVAGGEFTRVASAAAPTTAIARSDGAARWETRRPAADLGRLHRRRHPVQRGRHRDRGLRGRPPAADEQQLRHRARAGPGAVAREGIAALEPGQRPVLEPRTRPRRGRLRPGRHRPGPLDRQRHRPHRPLRIPRPHRLHAPGRRHPGPQVPGRDPAGDLFRLGIDGATSGFTTPIALNGLTSTQFPISRITGMFFWNGRLYFRWFTPESGTLGADTFVDSGATDGRTGPPPPAPSPRHLLGRPPHRDRNRGERPRHRRPDLAVPGLVRPQPPHLTVPVSCGHQAPVAQGTEQLSPKQQVAGSSPARGARNRRSEAI